MGADTDFWVVDELGVNQLSFKKWRGRGRRFALGQMPTVRCTKGCQPSVIGRFFRLECPPQRSGHPCTHPSRGQTVSPSFRCVPTNCTAASTSETAMILRSHLDTMFKLWKNALAVRIEV